MLVIVRRRPDDLSYGYNLVAVKLFIVMNIYPFTRSPKFRDLFTGLRAYTLHDFHAMNDPNLIVKFLLCCRDKTTEWIHSLQLGCRT